MPKIRPARAFAVATLAATFTVPAGCGAHQMVAAKDHGVPDEPPANSVMICSDDAASEISVALGIAPTGPPDHTWSDHVYACHYRYVGGTLVLSVEELSDPTQASADYATRRAGMAGGRELPGLGNEAFATRTGSILARMHASVLLVDVSGLPEQLGPRRLSREAVGITVASVIMTCWTES